MEDPIQRHPTRAEQLDILATVLADTVPEGGRLLDLGVGTGYVAHLVLSRRPDLDLVGIDLKQDSLDAAKTNLPNGPNGARRDFVQGDLNRLPEIALPHASYDAVVCALTFHDLADTAKQAVIEWVAQCLVPGGRFVLYDRLRLTEAAAFPLQQSLWRRIAQVHGAAMRDADDFDAYVADLGQTNRPAALEDYLTWFRDAKLSPAILHLHGNIALLSASRAS
jgi:ubiquinone/menaquinone biosynthesis C-methylase UbiE